MPLLAYIYIGTLITFTVTGVLDDIKRSNNRPYIGLEIASALFIILFVAGFFIPSIGTTVGILTLPMLTFGLLYEFLSKKNSMGDEYRHKELTIEQYAIAKNIGFGICAMVIAPGYVFGIMLTMRNINL